MSFCSPHTNIDDNGIVLLRSRFLTDYMPVCNETQLKVYLYGLYLASIQFSLDNSIDNMKAVLELSDDQIYEAYDFLSSLGLVTIVGTSPLEVKYNSIGSIAFKKHFKAEKYADFNTQLEGVFGSTLTLPSQYLPYYEFMEETKFSPDALIMIAKYCVGTKGEKIRPNYVIAVAKNWLNEGVRTLKDVEERISEMELTSDGLRAITRALGKKSDNTIDDKNLYLKWTKTWGFGLDSILTAIKKGKIKTSMTKLDNLLDECFRSNCFSQVEIDTYLSNKQKLRDISIQVNKKLGVYYESVDFEIEKYISPWLAKGLAEEAIYLIAEYCFTSSIRTLEGMDFAAQKFIKQGLLTPTAIHQFLSRKADIDKKILHLLELCGITRAVIKSDREQYALWKDWGFEDEIIEYACSQSQGKSYPMGNVHNLLSNYKQAGAFELAAVKKLSSSTKASNDKSKDFNMGDRKYSEEEIAGFMTSLDDIGDKL